MRDYGWEPTVLTVRDGAFPQYDEKLSDDIPHNVSVVRSNAINPFGVYGRLTGQSKKDAIKVGTTRGDKGFIGRMASWMRANIFLPDARVGWAPFAIRTASKLHKEKPFDAVLTSGPPHSCHLIGRALKRKTNLPWVADFRDPWTGINFYHELPMTRWAQKKDASMERSTLEEADAVITVSPSWAKLLQAKGARNVSVVHNGYDEDDFSDVRVPELSEVFTMAHVGSMYPSRNPETIWRSIHLLRESGKLKNVQIKLAGIVSDDVRDSLQSFGLLDIAEIVPYVSHDEAIQLMVSSDVLLLSIEEFKNDTGMITGKLYEYLRSGRPVLALGPVGGDAQKLLEETGGGQLFGRDDLDGVQQFLLSVYTQKEEGNALTGADIRDVEQYSRRKNAKRILEIISQQAIDE